MREAPRNAPSRLAAASVAAAWTAVALWRSDDPGLQRRFLDHAEYVVLGEALASGQGLSNIDQVGEPPHDFEPPLYPAMLAALRMIGVPRAGLCAAGIIAAIAFLWLLVRRFSGGAPGRSMPVLALLACLGAPLTFALHTLADLPAAALALAGLCAVERLGSRPRPFGRAGWAAAALLIAAFWTRTATLAAALAAVLWLTLDSPVRAFRLRRAALLGLLLAGGLLARAAWTSAHAGERSRGYATTLFLLKDPYRPELGRKGPADYARQIRNALLRDHPVFLARLACLGTRFPPPAACFAFSGLVAVGFAWHLLKRRTVVEYFVAVSAVPLVLIASMEDRFLIPVAPFLLQYAYRGLLLVAGRLPGARAAAAGVLAAAAALASAHQLTHPFLPPPHYEGFFSAVDWLRANALPGDAVASRDTWCVWTETGLQGRLLPYRRADEVAAWIRERRVRWILWDLATGEDPRIHLDEAMTRVPGACVRRAGDGTWAVYEVAP